MTLKGFERELMAPLVACRRKAVVGAGAVILPVQTPLMKEPVVDGLTATAVPESSLMFGESVVVKLLA